MDFEAVLSALVKGYSSKVDLYELIEVFGDLVLSLQCNVSSIECRRMLIQQVGYAVINWRSAKRQDGARSSANGRVRSHIISGIRDKRVRGVW